VRRRPDLKLLDISGQFRHLDGNEQALTVIEPVEILAMDPAITVASLMTYTVASGQPQHKSRLKSDLNTEMDSMDLAQLWNRLYTVQKRHGIKHRNEEEAETEGHPRQAWLSPWQACP
jgi:hypothetical protein